MFGGYAGALIGAFQIQFSDRRLTEGFSPLFLLKRVSFFHSSFSFEYRGTAFIPVLHISSALQSAAAFDVAYVSLGIKRRWGWGVGGEKIK